MKRVWCSIILVLGLISPLSGQEISLKRVAVFPFSILAKEPLPGYGEKIQGVIQDTLTKEGFSLVSPTALQSELARYKEPPGLEALSQIAKKLGAEALITGSLVKIGPTVALEGQLLDLTGKLPPATLKFEGVSLASVNQLATKLAQEASFKILGQERIAQVEVKGNRRIEKDAILASLQTRPGDLTSTSKLREDLKAIFGLGYFDDVKVDISDTPKGRVVTFLVKEKPAIAEVVVRGNSKIKTKKILETLDIKPFTIASEPAILEHLNKVKAMYRDKGYYEAEIDYQLEPVSPTEVNLVLQVQEGGKLYVKKISFEGNRSFKDKDLKGVMELKERSFISFITGSGVLKQELLERDAEKLAAFYYNHGFIRAKIGEPTVAVKGKGIYVTFPIDEGPQYKVGSVEVTGDLLEPAEKLREKLAITKEKVYSREVVQQDLTTLADLYADQGYALADIAPLLKENDETLTVDLTYDIHKGEKIYFDRIEITGNVKTRDKVIRRELRIYEQELFSATNIKKSTQNLRRLEYFEDVNFSTSPGSAPDKMNLKINVKERPTGQFGVGAGYSSQDKIVGMIEISQTNLFGRGQTLKAQGVLGQIARRYRLSFTEPYLFDKRLSLGLDAYNWEREYDEYTRYSRGGEIRLSHPMRWEYTRLYWQYRFENVHLQDLAPNASQILKEAAKINNTSATALTFRRDSRDALFNPTRGSDNSINIELAGLGGDTAYTRFVLDSGWYFPLFWKTVGVIHGRIGYIMRNNWGELPAYEKFYLGGIDSIRGYKYAEVSPRDPITNERIGGDKFQFVNLEYRFPLYRKLGLIGLVFADSGNVYGSGQNYFSSWRTSVGAGIRWFSPLGPLRIEWGYNLNPKPWDRRNNIEFSVGGSF